MFQGLVFSLTLILRACQWFSARVGGPGCGAHLALLLCPTPCAHRTPGHSSARRVRGVCSVLQCLCPLLKVRAGLFGRNNDKYSHGISVPPHFWSLECVSWVPTEQHRPWWSGVCTQARGLCPRNPSVPTCQWVLLGASIPIRHGPVPDSLVYGPCQGRVRGLQCF